MNNAKKLLEKYDYVTPEQVKGRIKNVAKQNHADARTFMRIYMIPQKAEATKRLTSCTTPHIT